MFGWIRRNTRKAIALAIAPGMFVLAFDAAVGHMGGEWTFSFEGPLQYTPIVYSGFAFLVLVAIVFPRSRTVFRLGARAVAVLGILTGLLGAYLHVDALWEKLAEVEGGWKLIDLQSELMSAPPLFAPLAFAGVGALVWLIAEPKFLVRLRVGRVEKAAAEGGNVVPLEDPAKKANNG